MLENLRQPACGWDRLVIRETGRVTFLKPDEIDWIEAEGNYLRLHSGKTTHLVRATMSWAEERLADRNFLRISRSAVVNLERVKSSQPLFHGDSQLLLEDGTRLTVTRVYREKLDQLVERME